MMGQQSRLRQVNMSLAALVSMLLTLQPVGRAEEDSVPLPRNVRAVWDMSKAERETTPTRERVCINGLWKWQPAESTLAQVPTGNWGYFKVPGCWPGITDYMQKDCQTVYPHPSWKGRGMQGLSAAWYQREITIPGHWAGRRIVLSADCLNSLATVFVDGKAAGEIRFPGGELELTSSCHAGKAHMISLLVVAAPLKAVMLSYTDSASARQVKGTVPRRGLCGDVYLLGSPAGARIDDVRLDTSVRLERLSCTAGLQGLAPGEHYHLRAWITQRGGTALEITSRTFTASDVEGGRITFWGYYRPRWLWDLHTPGNTESLSLSLIGQHGRVLDTYFDQRYGFREFWIDGRDFFLNGTRIFLSAVPLDSALLGGGPATYEGAKETMERLKAFGINFVYAHNYNCLPGSHLSYAEILRAADDVGMLVALTQPHFSHYEWKSPDADRDNGYARHAEYYVRTAGNHPSVVFYSMSHNATGYEEDMNPDMIDGLHDPRATGSRNNSRLALRAESIVRHLDPGRIVYHHASGNLGSMHDSNFYPNFAPIQELSDWFEHWATQGVKPVFTCEYGAPFTWDWAMYRGWYKGERAFGNARVPWELCMAEWNAQFLGDRAFQISEMEKSDLRWEARQLRAGNGWLRWDYPYEMGSPRFDDRHTVIGLYLTDNLRAFRTWGVSATSPWEYGHFWSLRNGVDKRRRELAVDWDRLQRPGFSTDYVDQRYERMDTAFERSDWIPTADGQALIRNNRPLLAYIGGKPGRFTSKDHNFRPGETVEKQIIVVNNSREPVVCDCAWELGLFRGRKEVRVPTGQQERVPMNFALPATLAAGKYDLSASVKFNTGEIQRDMIAIHVLPRLSDPAITSPRVALFDPKGETKLLLKTIGVSYQQIDATADLSPYDMLIIGKSALTVEGPAPRIERVRDGLKVIVFEQTSQVLEQRLGFRPVEYGLRQVFPRLSDHPVLAGIGTEHLRDWRGEATILAPRLTYELRPRYGPTVKWCDIPVTRVWRCGNRGSVASVLIEKPARGNFLPIVDGGYSLQYSPLLEYHEGQGLVIFCQLDVTGRTEADPAAESVARNLLSYVSAWKPSHGRSVVYAGDPAGKRHLQLAGFSVASFEGASLTSHQVLVVGPGGGKALTASAQAIADWLKAGGSVLTIGLDEDDANAFLPFKIETKNLEHIAAYFDRSDARSPLAGVGPADVHNRDPRKLPLITAGAAILGDGILARSEGVSVVLCQIAPWQFEDDARPNLKKTHRRASFLVTRLLANMGVDGATPILTRFHDPVAASAPEKRWRNGLYLDQPEEWDDPYRFFRW